MAGYPFGVWNSVAKRGWEIAPALLPFLSLCWHVPVLQGTDWAATALGLDVRSRAVLGTPVYVAASVILGVSMAKLVEMPVLRLRDRLFPSRSSDLIALHNP